MTADQGVESVSAEQGVELLTAGQWVKSVSAEQGVEGRWWYCDVKEKRHQAGPQQRCQNGLFVACLSRF